MQVTLKNILLAVSGVCKGYAHTDYDNPNPGRVTLSCDCELSLECLICTLMWDNVVLRELIEGLIICVMCRTFSSAGHS